MNISKKVFVTGSAGFIGPNFVLQWVECGGRVVNLDLQTYPSNPENLATLSDPDVAIPWPIAPPDAILAEKDRQDSPFRTAEVFA
jgi:nucleoside-diphosphate-sugar epimerase